MRKIESYPDIDLVRQCFRYDNGKLFWIKRPLHHFKNRQVWARANGVNAGKEAGCKTSDRPDRRRCLIEIAFVGKRYSIHRGVIVWSLFNGRWPLPRHDVDHKDGDQLNDRIENLRECTRSQNMANSRRRSDNTSGFTGVAWHATFKRYRARIVIDGREKHLGLFDNPREAHEAYLKALADHHGEFARVQR